jgi:hypothetical protein
VKPHESKLARLRAELAAALCVPLLLAGCGKSGLHMLMIDKDLHAIKECFEPNEKQHVLTLLVLTKCANPKAEPGVYSCGDGIQIRVFRTAKECKAAEDSLGALK